MTEDLQNVSEENLQKILLDRAAYEDAYIQQVLEELQRRADEKQQQIYAKSNGISRIKRSQQVKNMLYIAIPIAMGASLRVTRYGITNLEWMMLIVSWGIVLGFGYWYISGQAIRFSEDGKGFKINYYPFLFKKISWSDLKSIKETAEQIQITLHSGKRVYISDYTYDVKQKKVFLEILKKNVQE